MRLAFLLLIVLAGCASTPSLDESRLVDLSYPFDERSVYWPTAEPFHLEHTAWGTDASGRWYAANEFRAAEHGGTHLDAPLHFAQGKRSTADIPLDQLIGPARVIDVSVACAKDHDYALQTSDIDRHEQAYGRIPPGAVVLVRTGWGNLYADPARYLGSAERGRVDLLSFPGISEAAAQRLVERHVDVVGIDTASLDPGPSTEFPAHRTLSAANIAGLENVARLELVPEVGATVIALPMKIAGGTGGPVRILALLP